MGLHASLHYCVLKTLSVPPHHSPMPNQFVSLIAFGRRSILIKEIRKAQTTPSIIPSSTMTKEFRLISFFSCCHDRHATLIKGTRGLRPITESTSPLFLPLAFKHTAGHTGTHTHTQALINFTITKKVHSYLLMLRKSGRGLKLTRNRYRGRKVYHVYLIKNKIKDTITVRMVIITF